MQSILNLIRWKNLLMIALVQLLIKYCLLEPFGVDTTLDAFGITLLILATICIAAAGNIINDIYDIDIDAINKPDSVIIGRKITEKTANTLFIILNSIGVAIGFYLSNQIDRPMFSVLFIIISALFVGNAFYERPLESSAGLIVLVLGVPAYLFFKRSKLDKS